MISEEQLSAWERHYKAGSICKYRYETEHMPILIAEVRRLQKEADWLANKASINCPSPELEEKCTHKPLGKNECVECWREAAKKAVKNETV